jgi:hypothetical protein
MSEYRTLRKTVKELAKTTDRVRESLEGVTVFAEMGEPADFIAEACTGNPSLVALLARAERSYRRQADTLHRLRLLLIRKAYYKKVRK